MRFQTSLEYLVVVAAVLALSIAVFGQALVLYKQYKDVENLVNIYYNTTFRVLME